MLMIGAGGLAKDLLTVISESGGEDRMVFYDDVSDPGHLDLQPSHRIIRSQAEAAAYFAEVDRSFVLGIGKPGLRMNMTEKFQKLGGQLTSMISNYAVIGRYDTVIGDGCTILPLSVISNASRLGRGCLVHYRAVISHDCIVGDFCELSPGSTLLGEVTIGALTQIGANATILPGIRIGTGCLIGAGSVVNHDIPDGTVVAGIPAVPLHLK